jgi:hypothetical protein
VLEPAWGRLLSALPQTMLQRLIVLRHGLVDTNHGIPPPKSFWDACTCTSAGNLGPGLSRCHEPLASGAPNSLTDQHSTRTLPGFMPAQPPWCHHQTREFAEINRAQWLRSGHHEQAAIDKSGDRRRQGRSAAYSAALTEADLADSVDFQVLSTGSTSLANSFRPRSATA